MADLREEIKNIAETESVGCLQKRLREVGVDCDLTQVPAVKVSETFRHALERVLERPIGELSVAEIKALTELTRGVAAPTESTTAHPVLKPVTLPPITIKEFEQDDGQSYVQPIDFVKAYFNEPELFSIRELPARDDGQHFEVYFKGARAFDFFIELPTELQLGDGADLALSLLSGEEEEGLLYGFHSAPYDTNPAVFSTLPFKFNTPVAAAEGRGESFQPPTILRMEENASPESCVERILEPLVRGAPLDEARVRHQLLELGEAGIHRLGEMVLSSDPMLRLQGAHGLAIVGAQAAPAIDAITAGITRWGRSRDRCPAP